MRLLAWSLFLTAASVLPWTKLDSSHLSGLRGLSAVSEQILWTSGAQGKFARSLDGGVTWEIRTFTGADVPDFRDVVGFDKDTALLLASGPGDASRVYLTKDGGLSLQPVLKNPDPTGFFNAIKFWDREHGLLLGDPVNGAFTIFQTNDGGLTWNRLNGPAALKNEGAFAASGSCLTLLAAGDAKEDEAWFGTGGPGGARVFHSKDAGSTWTVVKTPLSGGNSSSGIFSLRFRDSLHGIAVGGDYQAPAQSAHTMAMTSDGGKTWMSFGFALSGFRSAITYVAPRNAWIAVGTSGSDVSTDGGLSWQSLSNDNLNSVTAFNGEVWAVGPSGLILKLTPTR